MNVCLLAVISITLISQSKTSANQRRKRSNTENFNALLTIYKMNPLKHSNVYKTFSNRVLLPRPDEESPDLNYNSNESTKKPNVTNVKSVPIKENHYAQQPVIEPLNVNDKTENFNPEHFLNALIQANRIDKVNTDDTEKLISQINYRNEKGNSDLNAFVANTDKFDVKVTERNVHLKVFNLNKMDNNEIDFDEADVVVVK